MLLTYATISLTALSHNLTRLKGYLSPGCELMAIVKANAYGHGAVKVTQALTSFGVRRFAVASLEEGIELRQAGLSLPILVLGKLFEKQVPDLVAHQLTPVVSDKHILPVLANYVRGRQSLYPIHLMIETGMNRLGFSPDELLSILNDFILRSPLQVEGAITHLADADGIDSVFTEEQLNIFRNTLEHLHERGFTLPLVHAANSAAIVRYSASHFSLVRPGIMLYGYHTLPVSTPAPDLIPVLTLQTIITQLRAIPQGGRVGYNKTYTAKRPSRIAVLPIGYGDGLSRRLSNRGLVLIQGHRAPIIGLVCMDMMMVDVTDIASVQVGETVTMIGRQGEESIGADEVAGWLDTIPYEVLCAIGSRVPRLYSGV